MTSYPRVNVSPFSLRRKGYRNISLVGYPYKVRRRQIISDEALAKARGYLQDGYYELLEKIAKGPPGVYPS